MKLNGGSIWTRLLVAVGLISCIAALLLAAGMALVLRAERDFRDLAQESIPRVALAGELAEFTGELAALSAAIMTGALNPDAAPAQIAPRVAAAARGVTTVLAAPALRDAAAAADLRAAEADLRLALAGFQGVTARLDALVLDLQRADEQLRWTHGDVQDQAAAILDDLSFNMESELSLLLADTGQHGTAGTILNLDRQLRDRLQRLSAEAATLVALLLQARAVVDPATLEQVERLGHDTLDAIALLRADLPERIDLALMMEGMDRLIVLAQGDQGIFALMREHIALRADSVGYLSQAQGALGRMQLRLTDIGRVERLAAQTAADAAAGRILTGAAWLAVLTLAGVLSGAAVLLLFVRNRIVRPIRGLTGDLVEIADATLSDQPHRLHGEDEISRMGHALGVFRSLVTDLQAAHQELSLEVAERRRMVERLEQTQRELVQAGKMAALGQMSAAISHEINQPLAAMRHRLHNLRQSQPNAVEGIARIEALADRIAGTVNHLRRIARRSDHRRVRVRLAEPVSATLDLLHHRVRETGTTVSCDPALEQVAVAGDEILVEQVLLNVLGNALDAIADTGQPGQIRLQIASAGAETVELRITDTGSGLGGRSGAELVDPFFTTKDPGKGLGLGLSIAFNVMQDMGGHLDIRAGAGGQGAQVRLRWQNWREP